MQALVAELARAERNGALTRIELEPLSREASHALLGDAVAAAVAGDAFEPELAAAAADVAEPDALAAVDQLLGSGAPSRG